MESSQWENWNHLFCYEVSFLTGLHCQFLGVGQGMKQTVTHGKDKNKNKQKSKQKKQTNKQTKNKKRKNEKTTVFFPFSPFTNIRE